MLATQGTADARGLSWVGVVRLGLVQTALGSMIVLSTALLNRVMAVELGLLQALPGALIALHYAVQVTRPNWGHGSDQGRRRSPWILGGMALLAVSAVGAAASTALMADHFALGVAAAVLAFIGVGLGAGAAGTSLLALLATEVAPARRGAAASIVWTMMIAGFVITTISASVFLEPFTLQRMVAVCAAVAAIGVIVTALALLGLERNAFAAARPKAAKTPFREALADVWSEPAARRFTLFVFVAMLAYQAQDPILEPFVGLVFGWSVQASTALSGVHHGGVLLGMVGVALVSWLGHGRLLGSLGAWTVGGCAASGLALVALAAGAALGVEAVVKPAVFGLGVSNGAFAVAAIGSMMALAGAGRRSKEGVRMGVWGAAQAIGFGLAGLGATLLVDVARAALADASAAYAVVFAVEAALFGLAALIATRVETPEGARVGPIAGDADVAELSLATPAE